MLNLIPLRCGVDSSCPTAKEVHSAWVSLDDEKRISPEKLSGKHDSRPWAYEVPARKNQQAGKTF